MDIQKELLKPFPESDIEWRISRSGVKDGKPWAIVLPYITARAVMDRLDAVFSVMGWEDEYVFHDGGVECRLTVEYDGKRITKVDGAPYTDFEPFKGGISDALKRAAVKFGIGRYLYSLDGAFFANIDAAGKYTGKAKDNDNKIVWFHWSPPMLPAYAVPEGSREKPNGDPDKAASAINAAKTMVELATLKHNLDLRSWDDGVKDSLSDMIDIRKNELKGGGNPE